MKKVLILFMVAGIAMLVSQLCMAVEIATEAEMAQVIEAPMAIGAPADGSANGGTDAVDPSRGNFVWAPGEPLVGGANGDSGFVQFVVNIPQAGTYAAWVRVIAWDGNSDSFWVVWEPADAFENPQETQNMDYRWSVANGPAWHWDRIEAWKADDTHTDREWDLPAGPTTLTIFTREDATMLDCIFITDNLSSVEAEVSPRTPTDSDLQAASVEPAGKLAVTWGTIRSAW